MYVCTMERNDLERSDAEFNKDHGITCPVFQTRSSVGLPVELHRSLRRILKYHECRLKL